MNLDHAFPAVKFASAELFEIAEAFNKPAVKKYLLNEQHTCFKELANGLPNEGESAESYLRRQAVVVGGLGVLEALLKIEKPASAS